MRSSRASASAPPPPPPPIAALAAAAAAAGEEEKEEKEEKEEEEEEGSLAALPALAALGAAAAALAETQPALASALLRAAEDSSNGGVNDDDNDDDDAEEEEEEQQDVVAALAGAPLEAARAGGAGVAPVTRAARVLLGLARVASLLLRLSRLQLVALGAAALPRAPAAALRRLVRLCALLARGDWAGDPQRVLALQARLEPNPIHLDALLLLRFDASIPLELLPILGELLHLPPGEFLALLLWLPRAPARALPVLARLAALDPAALLAAKAGFLADAVARARTDAWGALEALLERGDAAADTRARAAGEQLRVAAVILGGVDEDAAGGRARAAAAAGPLAALAAAATEEGGGCDATTAKAARRLAPAASASVSSSAPRAKRAQRADPDAQGGAAAPPVRDRAKRGRGGRRAGGEEEEEEEEADRRGDGDVMDVVPTGSDAPTRTRAQRHSGVPPRSPELELGGPPQLLVVYEEPPLQTVYQRRLRPAPCVLLPEEAISVRRASPSPASFVSLPALTPSPSGASPMLGVCAAAAGESGPRAALPRGPLFVDVCLVEADADRVVADGLQGSCTLPLTPGQPATFTRLKLTTTSAQRNTLFRFIFRVKLFIGSEPVYVPGVWASSRPFEVFSHTQYLRRVGAAQRPPSVVEVVPEQGAVGSRCVLLGSGFINGPGLTVHFGGTPAGSVRLHEPGTLVVEVPHLPTGSSPSPPQQQQQQQQQLKAEQGQPEQPLQPLPQGAGAGTSVVFVTAANDGVHFSNSSVPFTVVRADASPFAGLAS